jgi:hypothetical protein
MTKTPLTNDELAALDRAALRKLIADTAADLSAQNPVWTAGELADALIATNQLVLIGPDAVEALAELQLAAFLAGRGSVVTKVEGRTVSAKPAPTMDDFRSMAIAALTGRV